MTARTLFIYLIIISVTGCASRAPNDIVRKELNLQMGPGYLTTLLLNKSLAITLKNQKVIPGNFYRATKDYIVLQTNSEIKYIPLNRISVIKIGENEYSLDGLVVALGAAGAVIGSNTQSSKINDSHHDAGDFLAALQYPITGAILGSSVGGILGFLINRSFGTTQPVEYVIDYTFSDNYFSTKSFNPDDYAFRWQQLGVQFPLSISKLKKLLSFAKLITINNKIGDEINAEENRRLQLFPSIKNLWQAHLFELKIPKKEKAVYFAVIIRQNLKGEIKVLKAAEINRLKLQITDNR